jgi:hypothetical protein
MNDVTEGFEIVRDLLATLEQDFAVGKVSALEVEKRLARAVDAITCSLDSDGEPLSSRGQPPRGLGYGQMGRDGHLTPDEAMIVASLPWFHGNMSKAILAHYPKATPEEVRNHAARIRKRRKEIEEKSGDQPWQTSSNWLGDLIED